MITATRLHHELRRHRQLAESRSLANEQNKYARLTLWIIRAIIVAYLIGISIVCALYQKEASSQSAVALMCTLSPLVFAVDFFMRFSLQQTPSQIVHPYLLLPVRRMACIDSFIVTSLLSMGNLVWMALILPYSAMTVIFSYGLWSTFVLALYFYLLTLINSQWYAIMRTLINASVLYWIIPVAFYVLTLYPMVGSNDVYTTTIEHFQDLFITYIENANPLPCIILIAILIVIVGINRKIQYFHIIREIQADHVSKVHNVNLFRILDNYGLTGQYIKLEANLILRNKNPRKLFLFSTFIILAITASIAFSDIYDTAGMTTFWCIYNFVIYGLMMLVRIMGYEGNYIDGLQRHRQSILSMLYAKYIFYCIMTTFPFLLMLPLVITGKWPIIMLVAFALFTCGFQYFVLFQLAVYNKQTMPLNTKLTSRKDNGNNYIQMAASAVTFIIPYAVVSITQQIFSQTVSYIIILSLGLAFTVASPIWLKNIYQRMMKRRYENLSSFKASR